jgi:hypothetical protein
MTRFLKH